MKLQIILAIVLLVLAIAVLVAHVAIKAERKATDSEASSSKVWDIIRTILMGILALGGVTLASASLTSCSAQRSITVQGTMLCHSNDSARVIISTQESYKGKSLRK